MPTLTFDLPAQYDLVIAPQHDNGPDYFGSVTVDIARLGCLPELMINGIRQKLRDGVSGKKGKTVDEIRDKVLDNLDNLYAGKWRARGESAEPIDPVDNKCYKQAKAAIMVLLKDSPQWVDKTIIGAFKGDEKMEVVLNARRVMRHQAPSDDVLQETIDGWLERNPEIRKEAIRQVKVEAANKAAALAKAQEVASDLV